MRRLYRPFVLAVMATCGTSLLCGCDAINPRLISTLGGNTTETLLTPEGYVAIVIMNKTSSVAQVNLLVTKRNGGIYELNAQVRPHDTTQTTDYAVLTVECDVMSIQLVAWSYALEDGTVVPAQSSYPPVVLYDPITRNDPTAYCGEVVYVLISGDPPNVQADMGIY
ncbi:MAG: hypothetical protein GXY44_00130, partial [Phycisphaerales bacterium]|nr:hypothetical protein [Phycisphaerales bacterium]